MNKLGFWKQDWFSGLLVALVFLLAANSDLMQSLERKAYDIGMQFTSRLPSDKIAVIAIDDESIANLGRWPWPREIHAGMIDILVAAHAKVIGETIFFSEPQVDAGLDYIYKIAALIGTSGLRGSGGASQQAGVTRLDALLLDAAAHLDHDQQLANSLVQADEVMLPMFFELGEPEGRPDQPLPDYVLRNHLTHAGADRTGIRPLTALSVMFPIPALGHPAVGIGHLNSFRDVDGAIRTEPLVVDYYDQYYPSLSLLLAARSLNLEPQDIQVNPGEGVQLGRLKIATDSALRMHTYFYKGVNGQPAFPVDSFYDVYTGKISAQKYRDKIVLIGASAAGVGTLQVTPVSWGMPSAVTLAHSLSSILQGDFFVVPDWAALVQIAVFLLVTLYLVLLLPRLKAASAAIATGAILAGLLSTHLVLMVTQAMWLQLMLPAALLLVGHLLLTTKHFLLAERGKLRSDADSAESNRMLGLAFQGQGQLDIAFDKFRKVPLDEGLMEVLYNLGLDFERKRQFNKAESVFRYMSEYNAQFRDLEQRLDLARQMSQTVILGGGINRRTPAPMVLDNSGISKPTLGRYKIEKELGKGAMGVVYYGTDPKIGREVAIKTVALSQEFAGQELQEVKERFFREAESEGRLNHPNIVSIYDAGEEQDMAYIAMEFIRGEDLTAYTEVDHLLPLAKVMDIVARVADALDYAHRQNVVHRDIKPANIMYDFATDTLKVTDFGLARIIDSSKTKTGIIFGTPSYMSPEQLSGKKIDGHSDLFSLGVTLYQLACGKLPFEGDSLAQLMYRIAYDPHPDILSIKADLPPCLVVIVNKSLAKQNEERYADGAEMADALRQCAASLQVLNQHTGVKE